MNLCQTFMGFKQVRLNCHVSTTAFHRGAPSNLPSPAIRGKSRKAEQERETDDPGGERARGKESAALKVSAVRDPGDRGCANALEICEAYGAVRKRRGKRAGKSEGQTEPSGDTPQQFHQRNLMRFKGNRLFKSTACKHEAFGTFDPLW